MHKLCEYIDKELEELEHKVGVGQKLSAGEIQYGDMLAHFKKSLLTNDAMEGYDDDYSNDNRAMRDNRSMRTMRGNSYRYDDGNSMARGRTGNVRRDSMGRYSRDDALDDMVDELEELMDKAPDEQTKKEFRRFINKVQAM
jgi:hypothetical protein